MHTAGCNFTLQIIRSVMKTSRLNNKSDEQLILEYLEGDTNSLGILYNRYYTKVYKKCLSFTKNTDNAFDLAQDVLMKAFSHVASFKGNSLFSTWLYSICHNHCISSITKSNKFHFEELNPRKELAEDSMNEEDFEIRRNKEEKEVKLKSILETIPVLDKQLLRLKYECNYSIKDLQAKYDLSASAVKMRLMRARQKVEDFYNSNASLAS